MATARASARVPRTSTRVRRTSPRQGPRAPEHLVERMVIEAINVVNAYTDRLMRALEPLLRERFGHRQDTSLDEVFERVQEGHVSRGFLERMFRLTDQQAANDLSRAVPAISPDQTLRGAAEMQAGFIERNTELIRLEERARAEVRAIIEGPIKEGVRVEEIRAQIEERMGVVRSRAELIARDQTLKTYGQIQEARQTDAGIEEYTWSTSLDERVRSRHSELEGTTQRWDSPPIVDRKTGRREHPGGDFQCRCASIPILPTGGLPDDPPPSTVKPSVRPKTVDLPPELEPPPSTVRPSVRPPAAPELPSAQAQAEPPPPPAAPAPPPPPPEPPPPPSEPPSRPPPSVPPPAEPEPAAPEPAALMRLERVPAFVGTEPKARVAKFWRQESQQRYDSLNLPKKTAINAFVHSDFAVLRALQQGMTPEELFASGKYFRTLDRLRELHRYLPALRDAQRALSVAVPTQYGKLYRGLKLNRPQLDALLNGSDMSFEASSNSTSYSYATARDFASPFSPDEFPVVLRISEVREGAFVGFKENTNRGETEVVLGKRTFKITGKTYAEDTKTYIIDLTETADSARRADAETKPLTQKVLPKQPADEGRFWSDGSDITIR